MNNLKENAAKAALSYLNDTLENNSIIGIGTGSTVNYFIQELATIKHRIDACVASSKATAALLYAKGIPVIDLNSTNDLLLYIDGADEINHQGEMIKGGGGALTCEKIIATVARQFICIADETKWVAHLGEFPLAIEVIPMARSFVARQLVKLGGDPQYREGFVTDQGNIILDVVNLKMNSPLSALEDAINIIPGVVENGLFAKRKADQVFIAGHKGITKLQFK